MPVVVVSVTIKFFFSVDNKLCKLQFSAFFKIQAKLDHIMGLFMPCVSEPAQICQYEHHTLLLPVPIGLHTRRAQSILKAIV